VGKRGEKRLIKGQGKTNSKGEALMEAAQEEGMMQLVNFPMHTKCNMLYILQTNCSEKIMGRIGNSDHVMILIKAERKGDFQTKKRVRLNWRKAGFEKMREEIAGEE
jgi:hypothetical protein